MSLTFNDTTNLKGIVQIYEREIRLNQGDVSGNATKLKQFTADANLALDDFFALAIPASGTWQLDDSNQTDYPIIFTDIISGQRDYAFTTDANSNLILDIYKVLVANETGQYHEVYPIDVQSQNAGYGFYNDTNIGGWPNRYDKTANAIFPSKNMMDFESPRTITVGYSTFPTVPVLDASTPLFVFWVMQFSVMPTHY